MGYKVNSVNGTANSYRSDGVDLETTGDTTDTTGTGAGFDLGWTGGGQWTRYTVNAASAGTYAVNLRLASPNGVTDGLHIANLAGTNLSGNINVPATGGWQNWTTVTATVTLPAGTQTLVVDQDNGGWNFHAMNFAPSGVTSSWFEVVNQSSGLCATAAGGSTANGTAVQQSGLHGCGQPAVEVRADLGERLLRRGQQQRPVPGRDLEHHRRDERHRPRGTRSRYGTTAGPATPTPCSPPSSGPRATTPSPPTTRACA